MSRPQRSPYRPLRHLATGGMGTVILAVKRDGAFRRLFAVKRLSPALRDDAHLRATFLQEAQLAGQIHSPHVVPVVDVGEDEDGPYLVMDYVHGLPLSRVLAVTSTSGRGLPVVFCLAAARQAALGLQAAHELADERGVPLGLVHRDVSPHNLLLGFDGFVRLTDFGVARVLGSVSKTDPGVLKGKLVYMPPEQLRFLEIDQRADLYSLGVVLYELLSGVAPFRRSTTEQTARAILTGEVPDIHEHRRDVHPVIVDLLFRLMARDRDARPSSAGAVVAILGDVLAELGAGDPATECRVFVDRALAAEKESADRQLRHQLTEFGDGTAPIRRRSRAAAYGMSIVIVSSAALAGLGVAWRPWEGSVAAAMKAVEPARMMDTAPAAVHVTSEPPAPTSISVPPPTRVRRARVATSARRAAAADMRRAPPAEAPSSSMELMRWNE